MTTLLYSYKTIVTRVILSVSEESPKILYFFFNEKFIQDDNVFSFTGMTELIHYIVWGVWLKGELYVCDKMQAMVEENLPTPNSERKLQVSTVSVSKREMQEHSSDEDKGGKDWVYVQIIDQISDGDLRDALDIARKERTARSKKSKEDMLYVTSNPNPLIVGSDQFAYRAIKRPNDEMSGTYDIIGEKGIDATQHSLKYISACWVIDDFLFPKSSTDPQEDLSTILLIYKNGPFRHPDGEPGDGKIYVHNPRDISRKEMDIAEADKNSIPTLKDNLIGVVQVNWED